MMVSGRYCPADYVDVDNHIECLKTVMDHDVRVARYSVVSHGEGVYDVTMHFNPEYVVFPISAFLKIDDLASELLR